MKALLMLFAAVLATGCGGGWQRQLRRQASVQHNCPVEEIEVLSHNGSELARRAQVDVCGTLRQYENRNLGAVYEWREVGQ